MKMIAAPAMAAIDAGEAIVSGAVEIFPITRYIYELIDVVDVSAVANAAFSDTAGLSAGVTLSGLDPTATYRLSLVRGTYTAYSYIADASRDPAVNYSGSANGFRVLADGNAALMTKFGFSGWDAGQTGSPPTGNWAVPLYNGFEAAFLAFSAGTITSAGSLTFYIYDAPASDNTGGLSIQVDKRSFDGGTSPDPIRLWGGYGPITLDGVVYQPLGDYAFAQQSAGAIGGVAQGLTLGVSGIEPAALELLDGDEVKGASVVIRRLIFASDGKTLLDHGVWDRGRSDTVASDEVIGGAAAVALAIESAARGLGHSGARMRADSDQRLISAPDGYFKNTAFAGQKELYWGGKKPVRTGSAVGGTVAVAGSAGGTGAGF